MKEWSESTFNKKNQLYERVFVPSQTETENQTKFVIKFASLTKKDRIIDVCCGTGRHVLSLSRQGYQADGLDISPVSIFKAKKNAEMLPQNSTAPKFYIADARELPNTHPKLTRNYDVAINLFSSFGYYEDEKEQISLLKGVHNVLLPKGRFLLDLPNKNYVLEQFKEQSEFTVDNLAAKVMRSYDASKSRITSKTTITDGRTEETLDVAMNLYNYNDISNLLLHTGFNIEKVARDFNGQKFDPQDSSCQRMLILSKKL